MLAEDFDGVALVDVGDIGDIDHGDIHTDIAHIGRTAAMDQAIACTTPQMAVESVGIADGDGGDE